MLRDSKDELKDESDNEVLEAREEMDEDIQEPSNKETQSHHSTDNPTEEPILIEHQSPSPNRDNLKPSHAKKSVVASDSKSSLCFVTFKPFDNYMPITERQYKAAQEAKLLALSKPELINVVHEEATNAGVDPKAFSSKKGGQEFLKIKDVEIKVLNKEHSKKIKKAKELRKKRINRITKCDELRDIIPKRNNKVMEDVLNSLSKKYERLKAILDEIRIQPTLPAPGQVLSQTSCRKRKHQELEPELRIPRLKCNRSLPDGVPFVNNWVIEHPENGIFFIDVLGDEAF
nr:hypothetical protein [Tanacetum cinerariifolium]